MPVPNSMSDLSTTAASNSPAGSESPNTIDDYHRALAAIVRRTNSKGADIAAAATTDLSLTTDEFVTVTGSATITSFGTMAAGIPRTLIFSGVCTITHGTAIVCPYAESITTAANDVVVLRSLGSGNWHVVSISRFAKTTSPTARNRIINGNFTVNQQAVSGTVSLAAGAYGHDGWKAGASGCTYTFSTAGNVTTLTITAGSLQHVIEGNNLETGTYTLSWTGTAQGKIGAGAYSASGVTGSITGGTNTTVEFNTGTLSKVQIESGAAATPFVFETYEETYAKCIRRFYRKNLTANGATAGAGTCHLSTGAIIHLDIPNMRAAPTFSYSNIGHFVVTAGAASTGITSLVASVVSPNSVRLVADGGSGLAAGNGAILHSNTGSAYFDFSAQL